MFLRRITLLMLLCFASARCSASGAESVLVHGGFEDFSQGRFDDGGSNLYVNANGVIETIHRWDINNDGYTDIVLANSHGYSERGPTRVFQVEPDKESGWTYQTLPNFSCWTSRIVDLDADGYADLVIANGENGITSIVDSYIYWGGPKGIGQQRTDLPTMGAYDVAIVDVNRDGQLDLIFPTTWRDHHNPAEPKPARVYVSQGGRTFKDAGKKYNVIGPGIMAVDKAPLFL